MSATPARACPTVSRHRAWPPLLLAIAALLAYFNVLSAPFVFDDRPGVERNESLRHLREMFSPPVTAAGAAGRPIVNASLALNYAAGGLDVRGYHVVNLLLHWAAALTLFGLLRRTLGRTEFPGIEPRTTGSVALAAALLWTVHPLNTESVACVIQRSEILGALFYFLTLYGFVRGTEAAPRSRAGWFTFAGAAGLLGVMSKEIVATAPLLVFLYDRTFISGSFRAAWRRHWPLHAALLATWLPLAALVAGHQQRAGTVGFGLGVSSWEYLLTQCEALTRYLALAVWPHPLVFDYGPNVVRRLRDVAPQAVLVLLLLSAVVWLVWRRPRTGFAAAAFLVVLAPSSSFVPLTTQPIAEHRMYLALAFLLAAAAVLVSRLVRRGRVALTVVACAALAVATMARNRVYQTEIELWQDTIAKRPGNARAHASLAGVFVRAGQPAQAIAPFERALQLRPDYADAHNDYGSLLLALDRSAAALAQYQIAAELKPDDPDIRCNRADALGRLGQFEAAIAEYEAVLRAQPQHARALNGLGDSLHRAGRDAEAWAAFERGLRAEPASATLHHNAAVALASLGRTDDALRHHANAVALAPDNLELRLSQADALAQAGRPLAAAQALGAAVALRPGSAELHYNLGNLWLEAGRPADATAAYAEAVRLRPTWGEAEHNLALAFARDGRTAEAIAHYERALGLLPNSAQVHHSLALALAATGRIDEAISHDEAALRLQPDLAAARQHLDRLRNGARK